jgi:2,3-bisphosphoglycerate-independent phosphoglycerate mutase
MDALWKEYPHTDIGAGGESIGLWKGHQGSSEIGHFIIGAGRNVHLPQGIVAHSVKSGEIFGNKAYLGAIKHVKKKGSALHLAGLVSDKGVHNYDIAIHSLIELAAKHKVKDVVVHFFTDGRDTEPYEAKKYLKRLDAVMRKFRTGRVGTVMGRYWIMDRDRRWQRVEKGYNAMVHGKGDYTARNAMEAIENAYKRAKRPKDDPEGLVESDEFIRPTVITDRDGNATGKVSDGDALVWVNFRTDRAIEATKAFVEENFDEFQRGDRPDIHFVCTFEYYDGVPAPHAFEREYPRNTFGEMISKAGLRQFRVTETEKWIYVTTIFSGMREKPFPGEERMLIPSDKIPTYDLKPKMHTMDIAKAAVKAIDSGRYDMIMLNFNNPDIIGHTGNIKATITGVEECDRGVGMVVDAVRENNGLAIVSADHGNAEVMLTIEGKPHTHHTDNNVPFIVVDDDERYKGCKLIRGGAIRDVTPTILEILGLKKPGEMTGNSLIKK